MKCAVTGATGFIGSELCRQLSERDVDITPVGRTLLSSAQLEGVDTLFHCAGVAHRSASETEHEQGNYRAVLDQAAAAAQAGVRQFVFLSSAKAGDSEDALRNHSYGYWKRRAEDALGEQLGPTGTRLVIVRPVLVYGVGVKANLRQLMKAVRLGLPAPPEQGERSLVGLADLCDALCAMLKVELPDGQAYVITDGERYSLRRIHDAIRAGLGRRSGNGWIPVPVWRAACSLVDMLRPGESTWDKLFGTELFSSENLQSDLRWQPRHRLEDEITDMLAALK